MSRAIAVTLSIFCVVATLWYVTQFGVNAPVADQWGLLRVFKGVHQGNLTFDDLWFQWHEHFIRQFSRQPKVFAEAAPWLSIGTFAMLFVLITSIARAGFGIDQAVSSRYSAGRRRFSKC